MRGADCCLSVDDALKTILIDLFIFGGLVLVAVGCASYSIPLAWIVTGAIVLALGLYGALR